MTALTKTLIEEIKSAPESVQREVFDFLASLSRLLKKSTWRKNRPKSGDA